MKRARILHNPKAGDEEHSEHELIQMVESKGFKVEYCSIKEPGWEKLNRKLDFLIIAGGDGTIRKVTKRLLDRKLSDKRFPLALLPLGTANNLANTLGVINKPHNLITWQHSSRKSFDVGLIYGLKDVRFFLEGLGYGVFPSLMSKMKQVDKKMSDAPEEKLAMALKILKEVVTEYEPDLFEMEVDGVAHTGKYLLIEIMNTQSIGPNLILSPDADPGDGRFELIAIPESDREQLLNYIESKINGDEIENDFKRIICRNIKIKGDCNRLHVDDELIKLDKPAEIEIQLQDRLLEFLI